MASIAHSVGLGRKIQIPRCISSSSLTTRPHSRKTIKKRVMNMILHSKITPEELSGVDILLGEAFSDAVLQFSKSNNVPL